MIDGAGFGFQCGVGLECCLSLVKGIRMFPKGSKNRVIKGFEAGWEIARTNAAVCGGSCAAYCTLIEAVDCEVAYFRQKDECKNTVIAGTICGWMLGLRRGFGHAAKIGFHDGLFFSTGALTAYMITRRYNNVSYKNMEKEKMEIPALAVDQQMPRSSLIPISRTTQGSVQVRQLSNTSQGFGFGGLYTSPKLGPYLSSAKSPEDKES